MPDSKNSYAIETLALVKEGEYSEKILIGEEQGKWVRIYRMKARSLK